MPFQVGQRVGDYEVIQLLGVGGMGHVYRVRNIISNRTEAMKVLLPDLTAEPDLATRFISEIRTLAGFDHPNIAQLHTAFQAENQLIMMMEFVEGYTLEQIATQRSMPIPEVAGYLSQTLSALAYAHERGVVHRDIKPANLMVTSHGIVKLMDFGIAKSSGENNNHTKPGTTMGSLYYMSPEQVRGSGVDARSDIYSVGIVMYELLAGRRPFEADTTFSILNQQLNVLPQPPIEINPSLPPGLNEIILRALAKDPNQRFQSAEEFRTALRSFCTAPSGHQVLAAITQPMQASTPAAQPQYQAQPQYAAQPPQQQPPAQAQAQQPYGNPVYASAPMPPPQRKGSGKALWIATGAIAVILAMVGLGFALPRMMGTHAASSGTPDATVTTTPPTVATTQTPETNSIPPVGVANSAPVPTVTTAPDPNSMGGMLSNAAGNNKPHSTAPHNSLVTPMNGALVTPAPVAMNNPAPPASDAALSDARERMIQLKARAGTAKRGVAQIRNQQEQMGLGLRGDVESAESRLDSYMEAANSDLAGGNAAGAARNIDKADTELTTLEKFLGR